MGALWVLVEEGAGEGEALVVGLPRAREITGLLRGVADPVEAGGDIPARLGALWVLVEEGAGEGEALVVGLRAPGRSPAAIAASPTLLRLTATSLRAWALCGFWARRARRRVRLSS
ncbi:MAG: hypothetical protein IPN01_17535 [Deltaproteobacteria bacterium]|nr:hypothetical protein [Deltaproteobacteria bacterium]